jgi:hypothetical protein
MELNLKNLFIQRKKNWRTLRKTSEARERTNNKFNSHVIPSLGI